VWRTSAEAVAVDYLTEIEARLPARSQR
jgi:hypothetical protein